MVKWETMWEGPDSQDVGLEAAIIERKRNSSLVESACAEDITGLNHAPKLRHSEDRFQKTEDGMMSYGFEQLDVFKKAYRISLEIHQVSLTFPQYE